MLFQNLMSTLLEHEEQSNAEHKTRCGEEEDDEMEEVPEGLREVMVKGQAVAFHDLTQELVSSMSDDEKRHYIFMAQQVYARIYA